MDWETRRLLQDVARLLDRDFTPDDQWECDYCGRVNTNESSCEGCQGTKFTRITEDDWTSNDDDHCTCHNYFCTCDNRRNDYFYSGPAWPPSYYKYSDLPLRRQWGDANKPLWGASWDEFGNAPRKDYDREMRDATQLAADRKVRRLVRQFIENNNERLAARGQNRKPFRIGTTGALELLARLGVDWNEMSEAWKRDHDNPQ
ncbi:MAG: hypothetical protein ACXAEN_25725 [Candidatus Thorarchaeota archaeon]